MRNRLPEAILSGRSEARETSTFQGLTKEVNRMGKELGAPALRRVPLVCIVNLFGQETVDVLQVVCAWQWL
jgi:hypothetical protein